MLKTLILIGCLFIFTPLIGSANDWTAIVAAVDQSVVRVQSPLPGMESEPEEDRNSVCAGFVINQPKSYIMTANHCIKSPVIYIDGRHAVMVFQSLEIDIAIITPETRYVTASDRPALKPFTRSLVKGMPIGSLGFSYGTLNTDFRAGYLSSPDMQMKAMPGIWYMFDNSYIEGMSGGPVFDLNGKVIGIIQRSDGGSGFGRSIKTILPPTRNYWQFN